jgi:hypothetical protein
MSKGRKHRNRFVKRSLAFRRGVRLNHEREGQECRAAVDGSRGQQRLHHTNTCTSAVTGTGTTG